MFTFFTNEYTLVALVSPLFNFASLNKTSMLISRILWSDPASDWSKTNKGQGCVGKEAEEKLSIQNTKNKLQQEKVIVVFIF